MELNKLFKNYVDSEEMPVFICDINSQIVYLNNAAATKYHHLGGYDIIGKHLTCFVDFETQTKIDMVLEWFKESPDNNKVFARSKTDENNNIIDLYICALRDDNGELIGFCDKRRCRTSDNNEPYNII